ncbi:MAG: SDR family oxidoreductase [Treponema sp.]|nr:SDR family oxidoreductase [Treponema sp.]
MKILVTGSSSGIGLATCNYFLQKSHEVVGIDINPSKISPALYEERYKHFCADISTPEQLPEIDGVEILVNNAGIQTPEKSIVQADVNVNLLGTMYVTQKYAFQKSIKSVLFNASVSGLTGNEFPSYVASKAGVIGYMKNCAIRLANEYHATCNALCFGGILTELNAPVVENKELWKKIMAVTPLKRWATPQEAAEWIYFMTVTNKFCTGQAITVSGGERDCADLFVWE